MNTTAQALVFAIASVTAAAALGLGMAERTAQPTMKLVKLERVVIVGKRADAQARLVVAKLPRVVIEGRRDFNADGLQVAGAKPATKVL